MRAVLAACASTATVTGRRARMPRCHSVARAAREDDRAADDRAADDRAGPQCQQLSEPDITLAANAALAALQAARSPARGQAAPGGDVAGRSELLAVADGGDDGVRGQTTDAGDGGGAPSSRAAFELAAHGSFSYSTSTASAASSACGRVSATTIATASPT